MTLIVESDLTPEDVKRLRDETPGCHNVVHFNHAGASLMPKPVLDATVDHIVLEAEIGGYEAADEAAERAERVYDSLAILLGAQPEEIAIIENATRAWDMAFYSLEFKPGDRILTAAAEYASNVIAFLQKAKEGVSVEVVPNDATGQLSTDALEAMLDDRVRLVAISHMPTNGGLVQPVAQIGKLAHDAGALFLLDACQSVGQMPLDVNELHCDMLSGTSRKYLRGPRGAGFLYVRRSVIETLDPPMLDLHAARWTSRDAYSIRDDAKRFENWERAVASQLGMGAAVDYALDLGLPRIWKRVQEQADLLRLRLTSIPAVTVRDLGEVRSGIVTFTVDGVNADQVVSSLHKQKINTVASTITSTRFDMEDRGLDSLVRASVHYITTEEEIEQLCDMVHRQAQSGVAV
jgi:cysteine desulfurase / selenocysteine lyase